ncbi:MAG: alkaline phosphatase family protein [Bacillota bacterium]
MRAPKAKKVIVVGLDGADPMITKALMDKGTLQNLKKIVEMGTTTEDISMFGMQPTITPPNWASLATGATPGTHGITCYWNHTSGDDLLKLSHGFNSEQCEAEYIWDTATRIGKRCILFNYPTSWPPTSKENMIVVDGTGINVNTRALADNERIYECKKGDFPIKEIPIEQSETGTDCTTVEESSSTKKFEVAASSPGGRRIRALSDKRVEPAAQRKVDIAICPIKPAKGWNVERPGAKEVVLPINKGQQRRFGLLIAENGKTFNKLEIYTNKNEEKPIGIVFAGQWSEWVYDTFKTSEGEIPVAYKLKVLKLAEDGNEMELYYNPPMDLTDRKWFYPDSIGQELFKEIGPMLFQSYSADDRLMLEVIEQTYDWYGRAVQYLAKTNPWDLIYLHVHSIDTANHNYMLKYTPEHSPDHWQENQAYLEEYYKISDKFVGRVLELMDEETVIFVVSDHGGMVKEAKYEVPLIGDPWNVGGKLLEDMGYTVIKREKDKAEVDWSKTKAIGQRSGYIYINLKGREPYGSVEPEEYDELVERIIDDLMCYRDSTGRRPFAIALNKDDMQILGLHGKHVGDIYFTFNPAWTRVHGTQLTTAQFKGTSVRCLFMMAGAGVKKGEIINRKVKIIDIVPTICKLTGIPVPKQCEGGIIYQALED